MSEIFRNHFLGIKNSNFDRYDFLAWVRFLGWPFNFCTFLNNLTKQGSRNSNKKIAKILGIVL
jgi:hypothetical protein